MPKRETQRVLICDDSITNVMILSNLLETELNVTARAVTDPRKVIIELQQQEFDLLLLDIEMPHLNGFQVMDQVRKIYCADGLPVIILTENMNSYTCNKALDSGANDFVHKPFDLCEVKLRSRNLLKVKQSYKLQKHLNEALEKQVESRTRDLGDATESLIHRLALAGEIRDNETGQHLVRVGKYARLLGKKLGLPAELYYMIEKAAPMHDIGKIGIPDSILLKKGVLDDEERKVMEGHTKLGAKLLGDHPSLLVQMAASIALSHHEKWDGSGYPNQLNGESIPIEGRIIAIADVFDALTTERPYKKAWSIDDAVNFMQDKAGYFFDPQLIELFVQNIEQFLKIRKAYADL
ncbi:MAG: response regulator [Methylococcales bacterium]|nr:response regulator [Methylococcales bacterium]